MAQKHLDLRDVCFEGDSGLTRVIPHDLIERHQRSVGDSWLRLTNGTIIRGFSSETPDAIRGHQFDAAWLDEAAAYTPANATDVLAQLTFAMRRKGSTPHTIITTTPRRVKHMRDLMARVGEPGVYLSTGSTRDNEAHLGAEALAEMERMYEGTRLGLQELHGQLLDDNEHALFDGDMIAAALAKPMPSSFDRIIVAIDPSGSATGDATGIVVAGLSGEDIGVLADRTTNGTPEHRYVTACRAAHEFAASAMWFEANYAGDATAAGLRAAWKQLAREDADWPAKMPAIHPVTARGDKAARAEPVVAQYERGKVSHAAGLDELHAEMLDWEPGSPNSPNRLDACVWSVRILTDKPKGGKAPQAPRGPLASASGSSPFGGRKMR